MNQTYQQFFFADPKKDELIGTVRIAIKNTNSQLENLIFQAKNRVEFPKSLLEIQTNLVTITFSCKIF